MMTALCAMRFPLTLPHGFFSSAMPLPVVQWPWSKIVSIELEHYHSHPFRLAVKYHHSWRKSGVWWFESSLHPLLPLVLNVFLCFIRRFVFLHSVSNPYFEHSVEWILHLERTKMTSVRTKDHLSDRFITTPHFWAGYHGFTDWAYSGIKVANTATKWWWLHVRVRHSNSMHVWLNQARGVTCPSTHNRFIAPSGKAYPSDDQDNVCLNYFIAINFRWLTPSIAQPCNGGTVHRQQRTGAEQPLLPRPLKSNAISARWRKFVKISQRDRFDLHDSKAG